MRWGLVCVALVACGNVSKTKPDAAKAVDAARDAAPDAAITVVLSMPTASDVNVNGGTGPVSVHVHTTHPNKVANVAFTGSLGTYSPPAVAVTTDGSGDATATTTFTAGATQGTETTSMIASSDGIESAPVSTMFNILALATYGNSTQYPMTGSFSPNYLLGQAVTVTTGGHLRKAGIIAAAAGPSAIVAIYTDSSGSPGTLLTSFPATALVAGVNEIALQTPVAIPAGTYWILVDYSVNASIYDDAAGTVPIKYISLTYGTAPPATFGTASTYNGNHFNYYIVVGS